jgi:subtilisin family serine protease
MQKIKQKTFLARGKKMATSRHGTAIASLLVGSAQSPEFAGLVSQAELFAGVVMQADPEDKNKSITTTESLILGVDWLLSSNVQVINLSLGGPRNILLEVVLAKVMNNDIQIVAAAGNGGANATASYPAAQKGVVAVSAIDLNNRLASDANQGEYIDLVAPGVDIWVPDANQKGRYMSGSSMAAPIVTASLALLMNSSQQPSDNTPAKLSQQLFEQALELGTKGKDPKYGWGLVQISPCLNH